MKQNERITLWCLSGATSIYALWALKPFFNSSNGQIVLSILLVFPTLAVMFWGIRFIYHYLDHQQHSEQNPFNSEDEAWRPILEGPKCLHCGMNALQCHNHRRYIGMTYVYDPCCNQCDHDHKKENNA